MNCEDAYNELIKSTEKLHELYYQQENADFAFSNALASAQNHLISSGLVRLVSATAAEIANSIVDSSQEGFVELYDSATSKVQADQAVVAAEEAYRDACKRYDDCIKQSTGSEASSV